MQTNLSLKTLLATLAFFSPFALFAPTESFAQTSAPPKIAHVLILGIDGLHAFDLESCAQSHPASALAQLKRTGITYLNASTSKPSDSFPGILNSVSKDLVAESSGDEVLLVWPRDSSKTSEAVAALTAHQAEAHISRGYSDAALRLLFSDPKLDSRAPDIVVEPELGVIYTNPKCSAIAKHGSFQDLDTHVPLVLSNPNFSPHEIQTAVQTTQIAPTILRLLNLDQTKLQAVQIEKTQLLPEF